MWYPVGFTAGYLGLLLFVAAPLRRSGAYTVPDFAEFRLGSARLRKVAMLVVVVICVYYLVPQYQGAGLALKTLLGVPVWIGPLVVGGIVITNVVAGGMRSITFVQAFQYWLKLTAIAIPALALLGLFFADRGELGGPMPPTVKQHTTVAIETDVVVQVSDPAGITVTGTLDGRRLDAAPIPSPGEHTLGSGTTLTLAAGAATPVVAGTPSAGTDWIASGGGLGGGHPLYQVLSIIVATFLGTMGLPHVLVRFYTNPDGRAARRTALAVIALLSLFYLFPTLLGASPGCMCRSCSSPAPPTRRCCSRPAPPSAVPPGNCSRRWSPPGPSRRSWRPRLACWSASRARCPPTCFAAGCAISGSPLSSAG